jgi:hypothetical protein
MTQIYHSGTHFVYLWSHWQKVLKSIILALILWTSGAKGRNDKIQHSGAHFIDFWSHWQKVLKSIILEGLLAPRQKVLKSTILEFILLTSGACCKKCSNLSFWSTSCILLEPLAESKCSNEKYKYED